MPRQFFALASGEGLGVTILGRDNTRVNVDKRDRLRELVFVQKLVLGFDTAEEAQSAFADDVLLNEKLVILVTMDPDSQEGHAGLESL